MHKLALIQEVQAKFHAGASLRSLAREYGIARGTVARFCRINFAAEESRRAEREQRATEADDYMHGPIPTANAERCPKCGYLVGMPCKICAAREVYDRRQQERHRRFGTAMHVALAKAGGFMD